MNIHFVHGLSIRILHFVKGDVKFTTNGTFLSFCEVRTDNAEKGYKNENHST